MDKKRIEIILTFLLSVIFIFTVTHSIKIARQRSAAKAFIPMAAAQPAAKIQKQIAPAPGGKPEEPAWGRCPFCGKVYSSSGKPIINLKLTGIIWDEQAPQALINNKIVKPGDMFGNYVVVGINRNSVILNNGIDEIELRLGQ